MKKAILLLSAGAFAGLLIASAWAHFTGLQRSDAIAEPTTCPDRLAITLLVMSEVLPQDPWAKNEGDIYSIKCEYEDVIVKLYAGSEVPFRNDIKYTQDKNSGALVSASGARVKAYRIAIEQIDGDAASVSVSWLSSSLASASYAYTLQRYKNVWIITKKVLDHISIRHGRADRRLC